MTGECFPYCPICTTVHSRSLEKRSYVPCFILFQGVKYPARTGNPSFPPVHIVGYVVNGQPKTDDEERSPFSPRLFGSRLLTYAPDAVHGGPVVKWGGFGGSPCPGRLEIVEESLPVIGVGSAQLGIADARKVCERNDLGGG